MDVIALIALVVSGLALLVSIVGTALANKRAKEALEESRKAARTALWSDIQVAVQRFIGFDPASEPLEDRLTNLRISMIALVDGLDDWVGLDSWLEAERGLGAVLGRQVMEESRPTDTVDERVQLLDPVIVWAQALSQNLRLLRRDGNNTAQVDQLRLNSERETRKIYEAHGWPLPTMNPSLKTLPRSS